MNPDRLTSGQTRAQAESEIGETFDFLASLDLAHLVVRVIPDDEGDGFGLEVPGLQRILDQRAESLAS